MTHPFNTKPVEQNSAQAAIYATNPGDQNGPTSCYCNPANELRARAPVHSAVMRDACFEESKTCVSVIQVGTVKHVRGFYKR